MTGYTSPESKKLPSSDGGQSAKSLVPGVSSATLTLGDFR